MAATIFKADAERLASLAKLQLAELGHVRLSGLRRHNRGRLQFATQRDIHLWRANHPRWGMPQCGQLLG